MNEALKERSLLPVFVVLQKNYTYFVVQTCKVYAH